MLTRQDFECRVPHADLVPACGGGPDAPKASASRFADQAAIAIENVRLLEAEGQRRANSQNLGTELPGGPSRWQG